MYVCVVLECNCVINLLVKESKLLIPGEKEVRLDASIIFSLLSITIVPDCHLEASDFKARSSDKIYVRSTSQC